MFGLCKGNEKGCAIREDAASLLAIQKKWILGVETVLQLLDWNINHETSSSLWLCSYFWPSVGDAGGYWQEL